MRCSRTVTRTEEVGVAKFYTELTEELRAVIGAQRIVFTALKAHEVETGT